LLPVCRFRRSYSLNASVYRSSVLAKLAGKHILSSDQFDRELCTNIFDCAQEIKHTLQRVGNTDLLQPFVLGNLFYEPSTRTTGSFHTAMMRLGGRVLPVHSSLSSVQKGETIQDTIRTLQQLVDVIVIRHPEQGSAQVASEVASIPVINAGDGANEHPTQALLDLFTIRSELHKIDGLTIAMVGDLKYGRTVHSLSKLLANFNVNLRFVSPPSLAMADHVIEFLRNNNVSYTATSDIRKVLGEADVIYVTRVQKERFDNVDEYNAVKDMYIITKEIMSHTKLTSLLMHPLPRVNEISPEVDCDSRAVYFKQVQYGMYTRAALLAGVLGQM